MSGIEFLGTGSYAPEFVADNDKFSEILDTSDEWIFPRTGIKQRHIATDKPNYYMGAQAALRALESAKTSAEDVELIIVSTCTPDFFYPAASCLIQKRIGARNAACFDVNSACTGFITSLDIAQKFLETEKYKNVLIVSSEKLSNQTDYTDRASSILFGDAAGAVLLKKSDKRFCSFLGAEGDEFEALYCKVHYESNCPWFGDIDGFYENRFDTFSKQNFLVQDGKAVYKFAVNAMADAVKNVAAQGGFDVSELDLVIPHQANLRIIEKATELLGIPSEKVYTNIEHMGNVSSACIPVALDELFKAGRVRAGMKICFVGFGAGLTYGAVIAEV
ncbi:MAG: ketoacyl-ACP synthase III [Lachnospiraceae bacterium]|nr:ketoacyl-ACP synthase III [Ruminococcus sp.]MCM1274171.1 ketoacyl-ACP synthase III [Lachnospiraceae bacterium]